MKALFIISNITVLLFCFDATYGLHKNIDASRTSTIDYFFELDSGLVASYNFNGNAVDQLGMHSGVVNGAKSTTNRFGQLKSALVYNGVDDYINLGLDFLTYDSMTISMWIFPKSTPDPLGEDQYFICSGEPDVSTGIYGSWKEGTLLTGHSLASKNTQNNYHSSLPANNWYNVVMFFDSQEEVAETYVNGTLSNVETYIPGANSSPTDSLIIGLSNFATGNGFFGKIDDLKIFNRKLSPSEIDDLYNEDCPDTLTISKLELHQDTVLFARSLIDIDTLSLDSAQQLYLVTPKVAFDSAYSNILSEINILPGDGCNQEEVSQQNHFTHRGIYINNFVSDGILGNVIKEDSLLDWCTYNDFNNVYLYNIGSALSSGMQVELDAFVSKAHNLDTSISVTFVSAGFGTSFTNIELYHDNYSNIPRGIVSEIEFWNGSKSYDVDFAPWISKLNSLKFDTVTMDSIVRNSNIIRRFYIGKIKNGGEPVSLGIAETLVINHDEIFLTNYHSNGYNLSTSSSENSIRNKLVLLGEAGYNLGKKVNVVILFNVRQDSPAPNIWSYFDKNGDNNKFSNAYNSFYFDFLEADDIDYKEYINLKGYGIYRHSDAIEARDGGE